MRVGLLWIKNVFITLPKNVLLTIEVTAAASPTDAANQKNIYGTRHDNIRTSGMTILIFLIKELIVISLQDSGLLIRDVGKTAENEVEEQKWGFLGYVSGHIRH